MVVPCIGLLPSLFMPAGKGNKGDGAMLEEVTGLTLLLPLSRGLLLLAMDSKEFLSMAWADEMFSNRFPPALAAAMALAKKGGRLGSNFGSAAPTGGNIIREDEPVGLSGIEGAPGATFCC